MAYLFMREALLLFVAWVVFVQVRYWYRWRVLKEWSRQNGCEEAPVVPNRLPWGLERYWFLVDGSLASMFPAMLYPDVQNAS